MALSEVSNNFDDVAPSSPLAESTSELGSALGKLDLILRDLRHLGSVSVQRNVVILSLVGKQMRHMVRALGVLLLLNA